MEVKRELFESDGHLKTETLRGIWKGDFDRNSVEGRRIASHLQRCKHPCAQGLYDVTGEDLLKSYEKEKKRGVWGRISSFFYRFFGGNEPFHG